MAKTADYNDVLVELSEACTRLPNVAEEGAEQLSGDAIEYRIEKLQQALDNLYCMIIEFQPRERLQSYTSTILSEAQFETVDAVAANHIGTGSSGPSLQEIVDRVREWNASIPKSSATRVQAKYAKAGRHNPLELRRMSARIRKREKTPQTNSNGRITRSMTKRHIV